MIELKNVKKTYKSKEGLPVEALKGIDLKLGSNGITFILGKSGSGKSTFLNILGGLDTYTSGDIIINGKSTKEFKNKDWDAYRNTYMGFIFQEFNLLDNYSVEDNIKLSMKLQNKKCTSNDVLKVLKSVDLDDILKRKTNELSGGQKQRVAIARALIKKPEIILADEPTGNLDSETSKQIFDILKKLSKNKLIVVVSHDEEAANKYADRIVRISDGLIQSDNNDVEVNDLEKFKLITAKLPFMYSLKMGLGNLFYKKMRLIFSIMLISLCLICFGTMISTLNPDINSEYYKLLEEKGKTDISISKYEKKVEYEKLLTDGLKYLFNPAGLNNIFPKKKELTDQFLDEVSKKTNLDWYGEYSIKNNSETLSFEYNAGVSDNDVIYYYIGAAPASKRIKAVKYDDELLKGMHMIGKKPLTDEEVVISSYIADQIIHDGIESKKDLNQNKSDIYKPNTYESIIKDNYYINLGNMKYIKIVGIIDYNDYLKKYSKLKEIKTATLWDMANTTEKKELDKMYSDLISDNSTFLTRLYVNESFIEKLNLKEENISNSSTRLYMNNNLYNIDQFGLLNKEISVYTGNGINKISNLNNNELIINTFVLNRITDGDYYKKYEQYMESINYDETINFLEKYIKDNNIINKEIKSSISNHKIFNDTDNFKNYKIIGVVDDKNMYGMTYYNKDEVKDLMGKNISLDNIFRSIRTTDELKTILEYYPMNNSDELSSSIYSKNLITSIQITYLFNLIGRYGTIFFLAFAILIVMILISDSIRFRKKEIGILRAIGCRSKDVIKMFVYECITLMIISLLIAFAIIPKIVDFVNNEIVSALLSDMNVMNFGIMQIIGITIIMFAIVIIASSIPLIKLTKAKPIDTILDK